MKMKAVNARRFCATDRKRERERGRERERYFPIKKIIIIHYLKSSLVITIF